MLVKGSAVGELSVFSQLMFIINADWPGKKYRWENQTESKNDTMRTEEFWEGRSLFLPVLRQPQRKQDVICQLRKGTEPYG